MTLGSVYGGVQGDLRVVLRLELLDLMQHLKLIEQLQMFMQTQHTWQDAHTARRACLKFQRTLIHTMYIGAVYVHCGALYRSLY